MAIDLERGEVGKHILYFTDISFFVNGGVGRYLITDDFCHSNRCHTLFENTLALYN